MATKTLHKNTGDYYTLNQNALITQLQKRQIDYIEERRKSEEVDSNKERIDYIKDALLCTKGYMQNGLNNRSIGYAVGMFTILAIVHPDIKKDLPVAIYDLLEPYAKRLATLNPDKFSAFYEKCKAANSNDRLPYTPQTAAMDEIAMDMKYYNDIRKSGLSASEKQDIRNKYEADKNQLYNFMHEDGITVADLATENHKIVANLVQQNPEARKCFGMLGYQNDSYMMLKNATKQSFATIQENGINKTVSIYQLQDEGLVNDDGSPFVYRFGIVEPFSKDEYTNLLYETLNPCYFNIYENKKSSAVLQEETKDRLKEASLIFEAMRDDGFDDEAIKEIRKQVEKNCFTNYQMSQEEKHHNAKQNEAENNETKQEADEEAAWEDTTSNSDKKLGIGENVSVIYASDTKSNLGPIMAHTESKNNAGEMPYFGHYVIQPNTFVRTKDEFESSLTYGDKHAFTKLIYDTMNAGDVPVNSQYQHFEDIATRMQKNGVQSECFNFLQNMLKMDMTENQKRIYDLVYCSMFTNAPVFEVTNSELCEASLVATRTLNDAIPLGTVGATLNNYHSVTVGPNCWADNTCYLRNTELQSPSGKPLYLGMNTMASDCKITGDGVIANTYMLETECYGTFDPYDMRKANHVKASPLSRLELESNNAQYGVNLAKKDIVPERYAMRTLQDLYREQQMKKYQKTPKLDNVPMDEVRQRMIKKTEKTGAEDERIDAAEFGMQKRTELEAYAEEVQDALQKKAKGTQVLTDDKKAKHIADKLNTSGYSSTVKDLVQEGESMMKSFTEESKFEF